MHATIAVEGEKGGWKRRRSSSAELRGPSKEKRKCDGGAMAKNTVRSVQGGGRRGGIFLEPPCARNRNLTVSTKREEHG